MFGFAMSCYFWGIDCKPEFRQLGRTGTMVNSLQIESSFELSDNGAEEE